MIPSPQLQLDFLSLFPELFPPYLQSSILGRAERDGHIQFSVVSIRNFATDKHKTVDDKPYGGGEGMILKADVLYAAWKSVHQTGGRTVFLSPQGKVFKQEDAKRLSKYPQVLFVCGHYEGVDQRFIDHCVDEEISIGDYVLTGGELPALLLADAITRILPGVLGNPDSATRDSLEGGLLKYPQYTRPAIFEGVPIPAILTSGNHGAIEKWRQEKMREVTAKKRPDLMLESLASHDLEHNRLYKARKGDPKP